MELFDAEGKFLGLKPLYWLAAGAGTFLLALAWPGDTMGLLKVPKMFNYVTSIAAMAIGGYGYMQQGKMSMPQANFARRYYY